MDWREIPRVRDLPAAVRRGEGGERAVKPTFLSETEISQSKTDISQVARHGSKGDLNGAQAKANLAEMLSQDERLNELALTTRCCRRVRYI